MIFSAHAGKQEIPIIRQEAVAPDTVLFIPQGYDDAQNPSLAFEKPLEASGPIPKNWKLIPHFFSTEKQTEVSLKVPFGTSLYGTGEVTGPLLRNGKEITLWNTDNLTYTRVPDLLYQSHPWVLGVRLDGTAFGVIFDTTWKAHLKTASLQILFRSEGPAFRVVVIEGKSPQAVVRMLAELTGKMPLPPKWALGFQQSRYSYYPAAKVREIANEYRARHLPCDTIWVDIHYMNGYRSFTFDPERFPDPKETNDYLHEHGFHSIWAVDTGMKVDPSYFVYQSGSAQNIWVQKKNGKPFHGVVWAGVCVFPDFTMPETRHWWAGLYHDFLAQGIDGVWNDMNEPSVFDRTSFTMPEDNWHRGGGGLPPGIHRMYHNVYGMLMVSATRDAFLQERPEQRPFLISRANYLGGQRYSATWTGDNSAEMKYLKMSIPMLLNLGLSGEPFCGVDLGGYAGKETPELFGKWIVMASFFPFARAQTAVENPPREPWVFGAQIEDVARTALERRYRLLPYLYTLFFKASQQGDPILQPLFFAEPKNLLLRAEEQSFLLGENLLIVPRWAQLSIVPSGIWRNISLLDANKEQDGFQPTIKIRGGAIVPLGRIIQNTSEESLRPLTLLVCLNEKGEASGDLYEDAGDGFGYQQGDYALTHYYAVSKGNSVIVGIKKREGKRAVPDRTIHVRLIMKDHLLEESGLESEGVTFTLKT